MQIKSALSALFSLLVSFSLMAQSELVIEVTTDNYPTENHWVLYQIDGSVYASSGELLKETTHRDTFSLDANSCLYWTIYDSYSDGMSSAGGGDYKIYFDGSLVASCVNPNFGDSISVYNLGTGCVANDARLYKIAMNDYISKDVLPIMFEVLNMGNSPITSISGWYAINGNPSENMEIDNIYIEKGTTAILSMPQPYHFNEPGAYTINVNIEQVNGEDDAQETNNSLTKQVTVVDGYVKMNMIEDFSSFECSFCPEADAAIEEVMHAYTGTAKVVKYTAWDFADTKYFPEIDVLLDEYYVMGLPQVVLNGKKVDYKYFTPTFYLDSIGLTTPVKMELNARFSGDSIFTRIILTSNTNINKTLRLRGMVLENECYDVSLRYENNDPYYNIVYRFFEGAEGITIEQLEANQPYEISTALCITDFPFEEGSFDDMRLVFYLQNPASLEILQSADFALNYEKQALNFQFNVAEGATDVDTTNFTLTFLTNRLLLNTDATNIANIAEHIGLYKNALQGTTVPFTATFSGYEVIVTPLYGWEENSTYYFEAFDFGTIDGEVIDQVTTHFTTRKYSSIHGQLQNSLVVYPNPATDFLNIVAVDEIWLVIYNLTGQRVNELRLKKGMNTIDIKNLPEGYYTIKTESANMQVVSFLKLSSSN